MGKAYILLLVLPYWRKTRFHVITALQRMPPRWGSIVLYGRRNNEDERRIVRALIVAPMAEYGGTPFGGWLTAWRRYHQYLIIHHSFVGRTRERCYLFCMRSYPSQLARDCYCPDKGRLLITLARREIGSPGSSGSFLGSTPRQVNSSTHLLNAPRSAAVGDETAAGSYCSTEMLTAFLKIPGSCDTCPNPRCRLSMGNASVPCLGQRC